MPELLKCVVCHGQVASDAACCPHCGSPDYALQITHQRQQEELKRQQAKLKRERQEQRVKEYGSVLLSFTPTSRCDYDSPRTNQRFILSIDGEELWDFRDEFAFHSVFDTELATCHSPGSRPGKMVEETSGLSAAHGPWHYYYIRVHPGTHTLTLTSNNKVSSRTFSCDEHSHHITIRIWTRGFLHKYLELESVTVN